MKRKLSKQSNEKNFQVNFFYKQYITKKLHTNFYKKLEKKKFEKFLFQF